MAPNILQFDGLAVLKIVAVVERGECQQSTTPRPLAGLERVSGGNLAPAGQHLAL